MKVPQRTNVSEIIITAALYHVDNGLDVPFDKFESSDFPTVREQKIWRAVKDVKSLTGTADPFSVRAKLSNEDEPVGGWDRTLDYFKNLVVENFSYYVGIFSEEVRRYRAWVAASNIADRLASGEEIETAWPEFIEANPENLELLHASDIEAFRKQVMEERINTAAHKFMLSGYPDLDDRLTYKFMLKKMSVISGRAKMGKCLKVGTKVLMYDGSLKKVEAVCVGDRLMGADSTPRTVLSTTTGFGTLYTVYQNKGKDYTVNEDHILTLEYGRNGDGYRKGQQFDIPIKEYLENNTTFKRYAKGCRASCIQYRKKKLLIDPYLLGVWLGDGDSSGFSITTKDSELVNYLVSFCIDRNLKITVSPQATNKTVLRVRVGFVHGTSKKKTSYTTQLRKLKLFKNKHIPFDYLTTSEYDRLELLAGLLDTDGYLNRLGNGSINFEITQKSKVLIDDIQRLVISLGFRCQQKQKVATCNGNKFNVFRLTIFGQISKIPTKLNRKQAANISGTSYHRSILRTGIQIEQAGFGKYAGFMLDGDQRFLLEDLTITHNSLSKYNLIYNILKAGHPVYSWEPEMGKELAVDTLTSIGTGVPMKYIGNPKIGLQREPDFIQKIQQFDRNVFPKFDLTIDDSSCYSVDELLRRVRICNLQRLKQGKKKISLLYLDNTDNLGEISNETNAGAMSYKIGQIFRKQQDFARTEDLHIGNLWQISRATEDNSRKKDRRPTLADLAFSDAVVRVVDWILLVYRESYYNPGQDDGETELIIAAQRGGGGNRTSVKVYKDLNSELLKSRVQNQNISERATALL